MSTNSLPSLKEIKESWPLIDTARSLTGASYFTHMSPDQKLLASIEFCPEHVAGVLVYIFDKEKNQFLYKSWSLQLVEKLLGVPVEQFIQNFQPRGS